MARDMTPVLKKCRALGIEPAFLGVEKGKAEGKVYLRRSREAFQKLFRKGSEAQVRYNR